MNLNKHELYCKQTLLQKFNKILQTVLTVGWNSIRNIILKNYQSPILKVIKDSSEITFQS